MTDKDDFPQISVVSSATASSSMGTLFTVRGSNYIRPPDDHPTYHLIGRVAAEWGHFERTLDRIVWTLSGVTSAQAACLTAQIMGAGPRLRAIVAQLNLRKHSEPEFARYISKINKVLNDSFEPQEKRNRIVHDAWYIDSSCNKPGQFRSWPAKNLQYGINEVDMTEIEKTISDIRQLTKRAEELFERINSDVEASLRKQREGLVSFRPEPGR
jgi:hypothetical protein